MTRHYLYYYENDKLNIKLCSS